MPIYEYRCPHCGHQFEVMHTVNATPPTCERCGRAVRRVFTPVGIIFKGSGWHITDYRKTPAPVDGEAKKGETATPGGASGDGAKSGDGSADKAAATDDTKSKRGTKSDGGAESQGSPKSGAPGSKPASRSGGGGTAS